MISVITPKGRDMFAIRREDGTMRFQSVDVWHRTQRRNRGEVKYFQRTTSVKEKTRTSDDFWYSSPLKEAIAYCLGISEQQASEISRKLFWYDAGMIKVYIEYKTFRNIYSKIGIPYSSAYKTIRNALHRIGGDASAMKKLKTFSKKSCV